uniref:Uncharacterized protein n=1 Tax=viral metagenome TaxID=1070528 RepID=A0A6M3LBS8_9ZZZZ
MIHFHCRKCAKNILTDDGKVKPTFTDGLCSDCDSTDKETIEKEVGDIKDSIIANLRAQVELLSKKPEVNWVNATDEPVKPRRKRKVKVK